MSNNPRNNLHGDTRSRWEEHVDSSTQKMHDLDRIYAQILQAIEDHRADELQVWVAVQLQDRFDQELKQKWQGMS